MTKKERREAQYKSGIEYLGRFAELKIECVSEIEQLRLNLYEVELKIKSYEDEATVYTPDDVEFKRIPDKLLDLQIERLRIQGQLHAVERHSFDFNSFSLEEQTRIIDALKEVIRSDGADQTERD